MPEFLANLNAKIYYLTFLRTLRHYSISSLHGNGFGKIAREVDVESLANSEPIGDELERDDVEKTLETVNSLGHLNLLGLCGREFGIVGIADDNGATATGNDLLIGVQ